MRSRTRLPLQGVMAACLIAMSSGCQTFRLLTDQCEDEAILVTWPATITRGEATAIVTLTGAVGPGNIDPSQFTLMREVLITGGRELITSVVWTTPAFAVNGGYVALVHKAPLATGQTEPVNLATDAGGWGVMSLGRELPAAIAVRAENFVATSASGSVTALQGQPLKLRIDVTARSASGEAMRLTGDAEFRYATEGASCS